MIVSAVVFRIDFRESELSGFVGEGNLLSTCGEVLWRGMRLR